MNNTAPKIEDAFEKCIPPSLGLEKNNEEIMKNIVTKYSNNESCFIDFILLFSLSLFNKKI